MPRHHEEIIGTHRSSVVFGNDWNSGSRSEAAEFVRVHLSDERKVLGREVAKLQNHVSFCGCAVAEHPSSFALQPVEHRNHVGAMVEHALRKALERNEGIES